MGIKVTGSEQYDKIGLIAGSGKFPILIAETAKKKGLKVIAVAHKGETDPELAKKADKITWIGLGQFGHLLDAFKSSGVHKVLMAGGITKANMFKNLKPDLRGLALAGKLLIFHDDDILRNVASELEKEGISVVSSAIYLPELLAPDGYFTKRKPSKEEMTDIEFGWKMAKELGRLDVGHCVVVKRKTVLALEAIDGTDKTILRGGELAHKGAVVIKVCKPDQDLRFDLPAVGLSTIKTMSMVKASALAIESGKTLIFDKEAMIKLANDKGISIVSR
ncbi:MAG: UDP-2,3-diacylglucosamine diphosphatase LpxI [Thermodesulfobacteriota bacterium]|nr:UDP-2,3-diacylglucosamine diphosphatase LpxI [Thermodesulfobacteriota bacterium]